MTEPGPVISRGILTVREALLLGGALATVLLPAVIAWGALQSEVGTLGKRADAMDRSVDRLGVKVDQTHDAVTELRTEQRGVQQSLRRIETALIGRGAREPVEDKPR